MDDFEGYTEDEIRHIEMYGTCPRCLEEADDCRCQS